MKRTCVLFVLALAVVTAPADARSKSRHKKPPATKNVPGVFDYYVLSLSWSPEHCSEKQDNSPQCAGPKTFGFVVHGLWPQYIKGYPSDCANTPLDPSQITPELRDAMPSDVLIEHEWTKHGTCSGLAEADYFATILKARTAVQVPDRFKPPVQQVNITVGELENAFVQANAGTTAASFAIVDNGRFLQEVRACMTKDLALRTCTSSGDRKKQRSLIMRPVR